MGTSSGDSLESPGRLYHRCIYLKHSYIGITIVFA
jgi:hypothetical protein